MPWFRSVTLYMSVAVVGICCLAGCRSSAAARVRSVAPSPRSERAVTHRTSAAHRESELPGDEVVSVSHTEQSTHGNLVSNDADDPFRDSESLSLDLLIAEV